MLKIGEFSSLSRISIRMLRYYDENGVLRPAHIDTFTGYRYYEERQLVEAGRIAALRDMGFGVREISMLLAGGTEALESALMRRKGELLRERRTVNGQLLRLETALRRLRKEEISMKYEVTCKTMPERYVASVRDILPSYYEEGRLWHTLMKETAAMGLQPVDPCAFGIYHDTDFRERDVDVEIQYAVKGAPGAHTDTAHVKFKAVPPARIASATYQGSYDKINEVNLAVAEWVRDNGYEFGGHSFSIYHVSPHETQNPDELVTEVCYPVRKKG